MQLPWYYQIQPTFDIGLIDHNNQLIRNILNVIILHFNQGDSPYFIRSVEKVNGNTPFEAFKEYVRFLLIKASQPTQVVSPTPTMDAIWHAHILDTRSYQRLMQSIGAVINCPQFFIHHDPTIEGKSLKTGQATRKRLYKQMINNEPIITNVSPNSSKRINQTPVKTKDTVEDDWFGCG